MQDSAGSVPKDALVRQYTPLVKRIAYHLMTRLPASVEAEDLIQAGLLGLLDAVERFDADQGVQFETYASQRIRGAMLDALREADWASRHARKAAKQIEEAVHGLQQRLQRAPSEQEIAQALGLDIHAYHELLNEARGAQLLYYEDLYASEGEDFLERFADESAPAPFEVLAGQRFREALVAAINALPEREKWLMAMYYEQDMNFKEIGAVLGVTESRVCQLHAQAVARLRNGLKGWR